MDAEKLRKMTEDLRKTAVRLDRAITESDRAKRAEKARAKKQAKIKATDADPESAYEKIITKGKPLERASLLLRDFDLRGNLGVKILTDEQQARLKASFKTEKQQQICNEIGMFYNGLMHYTRFYLLMTRKMWQTEAGNLARLCQKWEDADQLAFSFTEVYYTQILPLLERKQEEGYIPLSGDYAGSEKAVRNFAHDIWPDNVREQGIKPKVEQWGVNENDKPIYRIVADVDGENGLYSKILKQREVAIDLLQLLRGAVEVLSDFVFSDVPLLTGGTIFPYNVILPSPTEKILDYPDAIDFGLEKGMDKYFAYRLRQRKEAGEEITPEEEKRAVIPDYNQVHETDGMIRTAKEQLHKHLPDYYDPTRNYE